MSKNAYSTYTIVKSVLDALQVGDLVKVNDWKKPMRIRGVSENYAVMVEKQFGNTYYSVIEKKPRSVGDCNAMRQGCFHCGKDDWVFGDPEFDYNFDNIEAVNRYLQTFERGEAHLSERNAIPILTLSIKKMPEPPKDEQDDHCQPCHNALCCLEWEKNGQKAKCDNEEMAANDGC